MSSKGDKATGTILSDIEGDTLDRERVSDLREDVTGWLSNARADAAIVAAKLQRAHRDSCEFEPVVAMVLTPLIKAAREIEQRLNELIAIRGK